MQKGLGHDQHTKYDKKVQSEVKRINFPSILSQKVNFSKINLEVLKPWLNQTNVRAADKVTEILGFEDEICLEFLFSLFEDEVCVLLTQPDPKQIFIKMSGFLAESTFKFMKQLWELLLSAQDSPYGIPPSFIKEVKDAIKETRERDELITSGLREVEEKEKGYKVGENNERSPINRHTKDRREERYRNDRDSRYRYESKDRMYRHKYRSRSRSRERGRRRYRSRDRSSSQSNSSSHSRSSYSSSRERISNRRDEYEKSRREQNYSSRNNRRTNVERYARSRSNERPMQKYRSTSPERRRY